MYNRGIENAVRASGIANGCMTNKESHPMTVKYTPEQCISTFWNKVAITADDDKCWLWTGRTSKGGYGTSWFNGKHRTTHQISWIIAHGSIPSGLHVLHTCDVRNCVNPNHLWIGTNKDNVDDRERKGRNVNYKGEQHGMHKLTSVQIKEIRKRYATGGVNQYQLADEYRVSQVHIGRIVNRKVWTHE